MEWILGSDSGIRIFAPKYPTRKARVFGQLWYLPTSKAIMIDLKLVIYAKSAENSVVMVRFNVLLDTYLKPLCLWDHFTCDAIVFWYSFTWTWPVIYLIPDSRPKFVDSYPFHPLLIWLLLQIYPNMKCYILLQLTVCHSYWLALSVRISILPGNSKKIKLSQVLWYCTKLACACLYRNWKRFLSLWNVSFHTLQFLKMNIKHKLAICPHCSGR